jgi:2-amino-4-hydroxy-6-hydroxymethyldihydropteridine diphosphokinase
MARAARFYLGLGSNTGDRRANLARARELLEAAGVRVRRASKLYRTEPVGFARQRWFYNQVVLVEAALSAFELLKVTQGVEHLMKRRPSLPNGPRRIDIDILLAGKTVIRTRNLVVPHPRMAGRNFVLVPLREIAPDVVHPVLAATAAALCGGSPDRHAVREVRPRRASRLTGPRPRVESPSPAGPPSPRRRTRRSGAA